MNAKELRDFDEASNHSYECKCKLCRRWWQMVGPEPKDIPCNEPPRTTPVNKEETTEQQK